MSTFFSSPYSVYGGIIGVIIIVLVIVRVMVKKQGDQGTGSSLTAENTPQTVNTVVVETHLVPNPESHVPTIESAQTLPATQQTVPPISSWKPSEDAAIVKEEGVNQEITEESLSTTNEKRG